jgi:hypothetical protein
MTVYVKTAWSTSTAPGISAGNLNNLETQYDCFVSSYSTNTPLPDSTTPTTGTSSYWSQGDHVHQVPMLFWKTTVSDTLILSTDSSGSYDTAGAWVAVRSFTIPPQVVIGSSFRFKVDIGAYSSAVDYSFYRGKIGGSFASTETYAWDRSTDWLTGTFDVTYNGPNVAAGYYGQAILYVYNVAGQGACCYRNFRMYGDTTAGVPSLWG